MFFHNRLQLWAAWELHTTLFNLATETFKGNDTFCPSDHCTCERSRLKSIYCCHHLFYFFTHNNASNKTEEPLERSCDYTSPLQGACEADTARAKPAGQRQICNTVETLQRHCGKELEADAQADLKSDGKKFSLGLRAYVIHMGTEHCKPGKQASREILKSIFSFPLKLFHLFWHYKIDGSSLHLHKPQALKAKTFWHL